MTYRVALSEAAEAETEAAYLWLLRRAPERAARWYEGLLAAIGSLAEFPDRCPLARENGLFEQEIRQLLHGRGRNAYRILFTIFEPDAVESEPVVRVLHVRHCAQRDLGLDPDADAVE